MREQFMKKKTIMFFVVLLCSMSMMSCAHFTESHLSENEKGILAETAAPTLAWSHALTNERIGSALIENGFAYFATWSDATSTTTEIKAYDLQAKSVRWATSETTDTHLLSGNGKLFLLDENRSVLSALAEEDGAIIWHISLPAQAHEMAFGDDLLFLSIGEVVFAVDATDGQVAWQRPLPSGFGVNSAWLGNSNVYRDYDALSYYDDVLYVRLWHTAIGSQTIECLFLAMNAVNGLEIWRFAFDMPAPEESPPKMIASQPAFGGDYLFFSDWTGRTYLMEKDAGEIIWQGVSEFPVVRPVLRNKCVYLPTRDNLLCLDSATGERVWAASLSEVRIASPIRVVEDKVMFIVDHWREERTELVQINSETGELVSRLEIPLAKDCRSCITAFEVESDRLYIIQQRTLIAVDLLPWPEH